MKRTEIEDYLENECHFRDYEFRPLKDFGTEQAGQIGIHLKCPTEGHINDALADFTRNDHTLIYIYIKESKQ